MKSFLSFLLLVGLCIPTAVAQQTNEQKAPRVQTANGVVQGINDSGVLMFKGIPFAQPPTGDLRWKAPQPVKDWDGVLKTNHFGPRCMQRRIFGDMVFRSDGMNEDCLYLNIWIPANSGDQKLPVLIYFYGGGFIAGDGSEPRYAGESMARNKGIIAITVNYRLGVFGFLSHPQLTKESSHHTSGDYGLLDQVQALRWIKKNIAAFGGDPNKITIAGESAGSISVSALMASPLSRDMFRGAIGESGSILGALSAVPQSQGEQVGTQFQQMVGAKSLTDMREMPAKEILKATAQQNAPRFPITVDGYLFPKSPFKIYEAGEQSQVPLLVGWNSQEMDYHFLMGSAEPSPANFDSVVHKLYGKHADQILKYYPASTREQTQKSATALASDRFIAFSTWKWSYMQSKTGGNNLVYRYYYSHPRPAPKNSDQPAPEGAVHSSEIEYAMGNLPTNKVYDWSPEDYKVSHIMQNYFANFVKTGSPNGMGLPTWKPLSDGDMPQVIHIDVNTRLESFTHRDRYLFLDKISK